MKAHCVICTGPIYGKKAVGDDKFRLRGEIVAIATVHKGKAGYAHVGCKKLPTKEAIQTAMRDAEREGCPYDAADLAAEFGVPMSVLESILEGRLR